MLFVGDVMQHDGQINAARNKTNGTYEYEDGFKFVKPIIHEYDIRIANLEVTLAGKPFKGYPQFSAPDELAETLVSSGFNVILTANNHSCDRGSKGVIRTLDQLDKLGVKHTGTFRNQEERDKNYPLVVEENGIKIAMLNYTYGTNGLEVAKPLIINYIDSTIIKEDIAKAKTMNVDYIVCNMHWGTEYKFLPNKYQKTYEAVCYRAGADMVIGGHPHVVQPIVKKTINEKDKLTVWSLGNFVSNMQTRPTRGGLMVGAFIQKRPEHIQITKVQHHLVYTLKKNEGAVTQYYILPDFDYNTYRPGFIDATNTTHYNNFMSDSRKLFGEHNAGTNEHIVDPESSIGTLYKKLLGGYYSVEIPNGDDKLLLDENLKNYVHEYVDKDGTSHLLSGVFDSQEHAVGNQAFIRDLHFDGEVKIVYITPSSGQVTQSEEK